MRSFTQDRILSTKEASELSGYSADYLARLTRAGKIKGQRFGRSWFIEKRSLDLFMAEQEERKVARSKQLISEREKEYAAPPKAPVVRTNTTQLPVPVYGIGGAPLGVHAVAAFAAFAVIFSGTLVANGSLLATLGTRVLAVVDEVSVGFHEQFDSLPAHIASKIEMSAQVFDGRAHSVPTAPQEAVMHLGATEVAFSANTSFESRQQAIQASIASVFAAGGGVSATHAASTSAQQDATAPIGAFSFAALRQASAAVVSSLPERLYTATVALGSGVISATHLAIQTEVHLVYRFVEVTPVVAEHSFMFAYRLGSGLAYVATNTPRVATNTFLALTALPSEIAPRLASAVWEREYAAAYQFVAVAHSLSNGYLASVQKIGEGAYLGTHYALAGATQGATYASALLALLQNPKTQ